MEKIKILVIDDDPATCGLLETILQMEDYRTASAQKIESEIRILLNKEIPHLLVMDFHLGSKETVQYISDIRADGKWQYLPIIMTSAIDRRKNCLEAGANSFILKPFNWQELTKIVKQLLDDAEKEG